MISCNLRIGPSGWRHPHWDGVVYPRPRPRGFHPLEFLACYFNTVEVDATFFGAVRPEVARLWLAKVAHNPDFAFAARLWRRFTHDRSLDPSDIARFKEGLWPWHRAGRLGCLVMQFPWSFRFTEENREFLIRLRRTFHEFPLAVEMRHNSWMADEALGTLIDYRLGFSNIDQPDYARAMPPAAFVTSPVGSIRLHGRNPSYWRREFQGAAAARRPNDYFYCSAELEEWKARIEHVCEYARTTYVITTNDAGGKSVVNALQLQSLLTGLRAGARSKHPSQGGLFEKLNRAVA